MTKTGCYETTAVTVMCAVCGNVPKRGETVHCSKVAGELKYYCQRDCPLCREVANG